MNGTALPARQAGANVPPLPYGAPLDEPDTTRAIEFPWLLPPVTATYRTPRARLSRWFRIRLVPELNPLARPSTFGTTVALVAAVLAVPASQYAAVAL